MAVKKALFSWTSALAFFSMVPAKAMIRAKRGMDGAARSVSPGFMVIITARTTMNRMISLRALDRVEE